MLGVFVVVVLCVWLDYCLGFIDCVIVFTGLSLCGSLWIWVFVIVGC